MLTWTGLCLQFSFCTFQGSRANSWLIFFFEFGPHIPPLWVVEGELVGSEHGEVPDWAQCDVEDLQDNSQAPRLYVEGHKIPELTSGW